MGTQIAVSFPESLALSLKMDNREFEREMKVLSLVKLYELGKISSGVAAKLLDIKRVEFLNLLGKYHVSYLHTASNDDLLSDFQHA
ncbi:UPF0175 family protein [Parapedobacter sp. 10938]|uniref:UPF0175 family protein n=1 Tax=Parapedobacter flavus TaxID=3110225 RepID=UPI002DB6CFC0|nr:UPF0175 family protein [Parapedobacter sp. 10938]MEC3880148.1 UPF0175 family protein [Parapedobacter sp. 10938]